MNSASKLLAAAALTLASGLSANATVNVDWIEWTAPDSYPNSQSISSYNYPYASSTTGTIVMPDNSTVGVSLAGEIISPSYFNASAFGTTGNTFWSANNYHGTTYISDNVPSLPTNSDRIAVSGAGISTQTLTFSSPVSNIVMDIWSLGRPGILGSWAFDQPFVILSQNTGEYSVPYALQSAPGNILNGYEGSGTIQFTGSFTSLSWQVLAPEFYAVWNVGVTSANAPDPSTVPEPGQVAASFLLLAGIGGYVWRKRLQAAKSVTAIG